MAIRSITPFLWFDGNAEEAVNYYLSVFPEAKLGEVSRYGEGMPMPAGTVLVANFTLLGQEFGACDGVGPAFRPRGGRPVGNVKNVFDANWNSMQRTAILSGLQVAPQSFRLREREFTIDEDPRLDVLLAAIDLR